MIEDIKQLLNFRFDTKYLNFSSWKYADELSEQYIYSTLNTFPDVFKFFKIVVHSQGTYINDELPTNHVLCNPSKLRNLVDIVKKCDNNFDYLVVAGRDDKLGKLEKHIKKIKHRFRKIYYEAKNVGCDYIQTIPMGLNVSYLLRNGGNKILNTINNPKNKTKLIGCAFGSRWPELNRKVRDRKYLHKFTKNTKLVENFFCDPTEYYDNLVKYKFFASPLGNGIQTPKICESILCETIPVVTDHVAHRELRDLYDLPLLIVNEWTDISSEFLNDAWQTKYKNTNWKEQKSKFLVDNFVDFYLS